MHHAITLGGLLLGIGAAIGFVITALGLLALLAAGMSDAGDDGTGNVGCAMMAGGALLVAGCLMALVI